MPKSYQPGQRTPQYGANYKITENRYAWVRCEAGNFIILYGDDNGSGSDVVFYNPRPGKVSDFALNLSNLTIEELSALKELLDTAFKWAEPVVNQRDKEAQDAWENGDDSHSRNYRPLPTVVYRKEPKREHDESVRERPEGVPEGDSGDGDGQA